MLRTEFCLTPSDHSPLFAVRYRPLDIPVGAVGIVHGLGDHSGRFESLASFFVHHGFEVICYDQRGHGRTGGIMPHFQVLVDDIDLLIRQLNETGRPTFLFGQSLGGGLVLFHALTKSPSIDGIIAGSPLLRPAQTPPRWKILVGKTIGRLFPTISLNTGLNPHHVSHNLEEVEAYQRDPLIRRTVSASLGISMLESGRWILEHAHDLATPTLIMHGSEDRITSAAASQQFASSASRYCDMKLWPGLYHDLHLELDRNTVLEYAVRWMQKKCIR